MTAGDIQAANDEAWGRSAGTPPTLSRMAELSRLIALHAELEAQPDGFFAGRAVETRTWLATQRRGFEETLGELEMTLRRVSPRAECVVVAE
jgi:hypothetical protein